MLLIRSMLSSLLTFALLASHTFAAPAPQSSPSRTSSALPSSTQNFQVQCLDWRNMEPEPPPIYADVIGKFSHAIAQNTLEPPFDKSGVKLGSAQATRIGWAGPGGFQLCLQNNYLFSGTTISLEDLGAAVGQISSHCCTGANCTDVAMTIKGDTGLQVQLSTQPYGMKCCGMFIC